MSADNYIFVKKNENGTYNVSHRSASGYYRDEITEAPREYHSLTGTSEGWSVSGDGGPFFSTQEDAIKSSPIREDWVEDPPRGTDHNSLMRAMQDAYRIRRSYGVVEYGVCLSEQVEREFIIA